MLVTFENCQDARIVNIFLKSRVWHRQRKQSKIRDIKPQLDREIYKGNQATSACHDRTATLIPEL